MPYQYPGVPRYAQVHPDIRGTRAYPGPTVPTPQNGGHCWCPPPPPVGRFGATGAKRSPAGSPVVPFGPEPGRPGTRVCSRPGFSAIERARVPGPGHSPGDLGPVFSRPGFGYTPNQVLCCAIVLPGRQSTFRVGFCRTATGKAPKWALWPAEGWPEGCFCVFPVAIRPKSGPEGRCTARKHYCAT